MFSDEQTQSQNSMAIFYINIKHNMAGRALNLIVTVNAIFTQFCGLEIESLNMLSAMHLVLLVSQ
jgi:hypothetical protein